MKKHIYSLPNILTYLRILAVPLMVLCFFVEGPLRLSEASRWTALGIFLFASITDFFDGYFARILQKTSPIGRMLDPIADKLIVSTCLLLLAADHSISGWTLWAAIIILCREVLVSGLREYLAEFKVSVPVSRLAKWKTLAQMAAISFLIAGPAGDKILPYTSFWGTGLLWFSAVLTLITGWDYFRSGVKHLL